MLDNRKNNAGWGGSQRTECYDSVYIVEDIEKMGVGF